MPVLLETEYGLTMFGETGLDSMKSVRKIPKSYRNVTGIVASTKSNDEARYESSLERDHLILLEFDSAVATYTVQPVTLDWVDSSGKKRSYTPDVFVVYKKTSKKRPCLYEVKYRSELKEKWEELRPKFKAAIAFAKAQGWRFKIITDKEIKKDLTENARFLLRYRYSIPHVSRMDRLFAKFEQLKAITPTKNTTPRALLSHISECEWEQAQFLTVLWYFIATFQIQADLEQPLTMISPIW